jgi:uncharacterized protein (UPF0179 family)
MAKALFGYVGISSDPQLLAEVRRLRLRVRELEGELNRCQETNEALMSAVSVHDADIIRLSESEPALT